MKKGKSFLNADSGWRHTGWAVRLPPGFGSVLYRIGEVFHGFQKEEEEGSGHVLIKGNFLGTRGKRRKAAQGRREG